MQEKIDDSSCKLDCTFSCPPSLHTSSGGVTGSWWSWASLRPGGRLITPGPEHFILLQGLYVYIWYCSRALQVSLLQRTLPLLAAALTLLPPCRVSVGSAVLMRGEGGVWGRATVQEELMGEYLVKSSTVTVFSSFAYSRIHPGWEWTSHKDDRGAASLAQGGRRQWRWWRWGRRNRTRCWGGGLFFSTHRTFCWGKCRLGKP